MQLRLLLLSRDPDPRVGKQETVAQEERRKQSEGEELRRADAGRGDGEAEEAEREPAKEGAARQPALDSPEECPADQACDRAREHHVQRAAQAERPRSPVERTKSRITRRPPKPSIRAPQAVPKAR